MTSWNVKFVPFSSAADSPFWVRYCRQKLETIQLSEDPISFRAAYNSRLLECSESSLLSGSIIPNERICVDGILLGFNTMETFQQVDKNDLLNKHFLPHFFSDEKRLQTVLLITFADLKQHKVLYWYGVPALLPAQGKSITASKQEWWGWSGEEKALFWENLHLMRKNQGRLDPCFIATKTKCVSLAEFVSVRGENDLLFAFFDFSEKVEDLFKGPASMGWTMRNLVAYLCFHLNLGGQSVSILSFRGQQLRRWDVLTKPQEYDATLDHSIVVQIQVPTKDDYDWRFNSTQVNSPPEYRSTGWELNVRGKPGPRWMNLQPLLDPTHLAIQAADLNLKLMKWRMIPELQVEKLQRTRVLLLGAGTLGCNVARVLLGWGVRHFDFVDYGKVSYSNPVRQSLFTLEDCHDGGRPKAEAAADALRQIAADVVSRGHQLSIPMPGHAAVEEDAVDRLDQLIQECDVVYLLTDTRESRWLPTVMAAAYNKVMINAALGLDSWLVMRHGGGFGCYFCNDIVAPENSMKNRTLDQQCTVTRPGLAPIASSMAVELMVSLLHHPDGINASAPKSGLNPFSPTVDSESPLGLIPHQIRGSLVSYTMMTPTVPAFTYCTACSKSVIETYLNDKSATVLQACKDGDYLERLSGLQTFRAEAASKFEDTWDEDDVLDEE
jgi:ubiquitin-like modifier-activating enzyme ATG7